MKQYKVRELLKIKNGKDHKHLGIGEIPIYGSGGVMRYGDQYIYNKESILLPRKGTLSNIQWVDEPFWTVDTIYYSEINQELVDGYFLYSYLKSLDLSNLNSGTGVPSMTFDAYYDINVQLPELALQKKISAILKKIQQKVELNYHINAELEAMAKTIYDYWFVQFDFPISAEQAASMGKPELEGKPYKSSGGSMVWNEGLKREIPEGWEVKDLYTIANYINGLACQKYRPKTEYDDFLPVIKIKEMNDGLSSNSERVRLDIPKKYIIDDGDVLFSWSATLDVKIWTEGKGALNQHIFKIESNKYPKIFYYFELTNYLRHFKMMAELRKTTMGHITIDHLKTSFISVPPIDLVNKIDVKINSILEKIILNKKENLQLASLRDWILPMLMNGQVTIA